VESNQQRTASDKFKKCEMMLEAIGAVRVKGSICEYEPMSDGLSSDVKRKKKERPTVPLAERPTTTVDEFCSLVGFGRSTFYKAVAAGDIKIRKYGKRTFVTREERMRFVENMPPG
jgi:excisionase family DNA binding protein